jgi:hypothetical protein
VQILCCKKINDLYKKKKLTEIRLQKAAKLWGYLNGVHFFVFLAIYIAKLIYIRNKLLGEGVELIN